MNLVQICEHLLCNRLAVPGSLFCAPCMGHPDGEPCPQCDNDSEDYL